MLLLIQMTSPKPVRMLIVNTKQRWEEQECGWQCNKAKQQKIPVDRPDFSKKRRMRALLFTIYFFFSRWPLSISNQTGHQFFSLNQQQTYLYLFVAWGPVLTLTLTRSDNTKKICLYRHLIILFYETDSYKCSRASS